ncbi:zf-HC2 domain-containing protein [Phototrophicus methaneseepsis]|uniref:Zf-HC2 domain-containing protein n=1 Tax=Phototrophicus methaneseepsis TaxID=2710758 RepID=A0A7S8EA93_9CHLR|nr:zf-HC2 domain-containing protein [Phototrophicus methaneseepsis]QPC83222.1 zf-HC2 domain-containing protein [Phototrophicus methaneseepsis]
MEPYELTNRDAELLSAYIDGELDAEQRAALEARLASNPALRRQLRSLQQTVALVREMPTLRAPRDFTLTADMVGEAPAVLEAPAEVQRPALRLVPRRSPWRMALGTAAAVVVVMVGLVLVLNQTGFSSQPDDTVEVAAAPSLPATVSAMRQTEMTTSAEPLALPDDITPEDETQSRLIEPTTEAGISTMETRSMQDTVAEEQIEEQTEEQEEAVEEAQDIVPAESQTFAADETSDVDTFAAESAESEALEPTASDGYGETGMAGAGADANTTTMPTQTEETMGYVMVDTPVPTQSELENTSRPSEPPTVQDATADDATQNELDSDAAEATADEEAGVMAQIIVPEAAEQQKLDARFVTQSVFRELYKASEMINLVTLPDGRTFTVRNLVDAFVEVASKLIHEAEQAP